MQQLRSTLEGSVLSSMNRAHDSKRHAVMLQLGPSTSLLNQSGITLFAATGCRKVRLHMDIGSDKPPHYLDCQQNGKNPQDLA